MLTLLLLGSAMAWDSASTSAVGAAGALTIEGTDGSARHTHGGAPARLGHATFKLTWAGDAPLALTVTKIEHLQGRDCEAPPSQVSAEPTLGGMMFGEMRESALSITAPPGAEGPLTVSFPAVEAYYVWCDRFAFRVTFQAGAAGGDETLVAVAETNVVRVEPLRR